LKVHRDVYIGDEITVDFITVDHWDEDIWQQWKEIYHEAFGRKNAKPEKVIRNMFRRMKEGFKQLLCPENWKKQLRLS